jgi:hypothetical protein
MSEFMFGVRTGESRLPLRVRMACERAAKELKVTWIEIREPTRQWKSWFAGPNLGHPFDADLQRDCTRLVESFLSEGET